MQPPFDQRTYRGATREEALAAYRNDATVAAEHGYVPIGEHWSEVPGKHVVTVAYQSRPAASGAARADSRTQPDHEQIGRSARPGYSRPAFAAIVTAVIGYIVGSILFHELGVPGPGVWAFIVGASLAAVAARLAGGRPMGPGGDT